MPLLYGRPALTARLHQRKAYLLRTDKDVTNAINEYDQAVQLFTNSSLQITEDRVETLVDMADSLHLSGRKEKAEPIYLEALRTDWFKVHDIEAYHQLYELYLRAGRGLINVRRNNLNALKNTYFWPAAMTQLGPELQKAIRQAGGSEQDVAAVMTASK